MLYFDPRGTRDMHHMKYGLTVALPENFGLDSVKRVMEARGYTWVQRIPKKGTPVRRRNLALTKWP